MILDKSKIKKVLVVSLSNIGDLVMTFPVIDILKRDLPAARIDLVVDPKGESLVRGNPNFGKIHIYRKKAPGFVLLKWITELFKERYDLAVDLRNSAIPFLIFAKRKTPIMFRRPVVSHMREQHLERLKSVHPFTQESKERPSLYFSSEDVQFVDQLVAKSEIRDPSRGFVVIAPGSRSENKRWREDGFAKLADALTSKYQVSVIFAGDEADRAIVKRIRSMMKESAIDFSGQLTLSQFGILISQSRLAVTNDSAAMHLASYLKVPVLTIFGPTDPAKCGPWSRINFRVRKEKGCPACAGKEGVEHECIKAVTSEDVLAALEPGAKELFDGK